MRKGISIAVTPADRVRLEAIVRDRNSPQKHVWRAGIVLLTAEGQGTSAITRAVGKDKTVVWRWQERFMHDGVAGLTRDKTRPSRIPPLPAASVDRVVALTNQAPPHAATHWTALVMAKAVGISPSSVRRIWTGQGLQPHRVRTFKISNDPKFADKLRDVVGLYLDPPEHALVLSVDEKSQIQALDRTRVADQARPLRHDDPRLQAARHDNLVRRAQRARRQGHRPVHEPAPASGVHPLSQQDQPRNPGRTGGACNRRQLCYAQAPQEPAPVQTGVQAWLGRHQRFHFHFTPTSASWLNAVEGFFAKLTRRRLQRGVFKGIADLQTAINRFLRETNDNPKPFVWTADPDAIIGKVHRGKQVLASIH